MMPGVFSTVWFDPLAGGTVMAKTVDCAEHFLHIWRYFRKQLEAQTICIDCSTICRPAMLCAESKHRSKRTTLRNVKSRQNPCTSMVFR
jgi:hypothetical protein